MPFDMEPKDEGGDSATCPCCGAVVHLDQLQQRSPFCVLKFAVRELDHYLHLSDAYEWLPGMGLAHISCASCGDGYTATFGEALIEEDLSPTERFKFFRTVAGVPLAMQIAELSKAPDMRCTHVGEP